MRIVQQWKKLSIWWKLFHVVFAALSLIAIFILAGVIASYDGGCTGPLTSIGSYPSECTFGKYLSNNVPTAEGIPLYVLMYILFLGGM